MTIKKIKLISFLQWRGISALPSQGCFETKMQEFQGRVLSDRDKELALQALANPPEANQKLRDCLEATIRLVGDLGSNH